MIWNQLFMISTNENLIIIASNNSVIPNKKSLIRRKIEQYNQKTYQNPTNMEN